MPLVSFRRFLPFLALASFAPSAGAQAIPAFPGAEGYGGYAKGGRGGDVYIVTNTNASGAGSFRDAIETVPSGGRTIVFAVSGHIHINGLRLTGSKVTIAGQTAPGDGVGSVDGTFRISGDDVVVRHLRMHHRKSGSGGDCLNLDSGSINSVIDSCSLQFSTDENMSSFNSPPENLTMQWSVNAWGLESHSCGGLWDQNHATAHHTLWAHHHTRNPKARPSGLLEWINNVTFDWDIGFIMGDSETPATWKANVRNSYFLCPPGNLRSKALEKANLDRNGVPNFSLYLNNCRHDNDGDGLLNGTDKGYAIASGSYTTLAAPVANTGAIPVTMDDPVVAFKKVVSKAGALRLDAGYVGPLRDEVDTRLIQNLVTQTANHITRESDLAGVSNGGIGTLNSTAAPVDTDKDGMPDFYEDALGWNKTTQDHNTALANSGGVITGTTFFPPSTPVGAGALEKYTRLEEYLHFLAIPHGNAPKNITGTPTSVQVDLRKFAAGFSASPTFAVTNVANGSVAQFLADGTTPSATGPIAKFTPTLNYVGRARFDFTVTDAAGHSWTQTCALVVTAAGLPRDLLWKGVGSAWDESALHWLRPSNGSTVAFSAGDRVAFDQGGIAQPSVSVSGALAPTTVEVNAAGNYTLGGSGSIASAGTLTKRGAGTLTLTHSETYAAGTALEAGALVIGSGGDLEGGPVTMLDATTFTNGYPTGNTAAIGAPFDVPAGNNATINTGNRLNLSGALTGAGTLNFNVQTTVSRFDLSGATAAFAGQLNFNNSGGVRLFFNGGAFNGFDNASVNLGGSVSLQPQTNSGGNTCNIGALASANFAANLAGGTAGAVAYVIGARNVDTTFAGTITGSATLTKTGTGALTLTGANTYTGATMVSAGSLAVNGSLPSATTVASGAVLRGAGVFNGAVTTQTGAQVSPGAGTGQIGTLTAAGGLTATSTNFSMQLSSSPAGVNDKINITGASGMVSGTNTFDIALADGALGAGNYKLIECAAGIPLNVGGGMVMNLSIAAPNNGRQTYTLNRTASGTAGGYIQLVVTGNPATLTWTGASSGAWNTTATGNWTGATPATFFSFDSVVFDDTATTRTVTLSGVVDPRDVTVNTALGYTFATETDAFDVWNRLTKSGTGTLTFTASAPGFGQNDFTGGVTLNAGTIALADDNAHISGGPITMNGGTFTMFDESSSYSANLNDFIIPAGATARINADSRVEMHGSLSGAGTLDFYVPFVRTDLFGDWSGFTGTINVLTDASGGDFRIATNYAPAGHPLATIALTANTWLYHSGILAQGAGTTIEIGALSGPSGSHLRGGVTGGRALTYRIGGKNTDATFSGDFAEQNAGATTALVKTGAGTWTLGGAGEWRGGTTVEQGTLKISGAFTCAGAANVLFGATLQFAGGSLSTDALNIAAGAQCTGHGTITGDLNNDGTLTVGTGGTLTVTGDVVNNGTVRFTGGSVLVANGSFVNHGTLDLLTSASALPPNLENHGVIIDSTSLRTTSAVKVGNSVTLSAMTYGSHVYQLQRSNFLIVPNWQNVGAAKAGNDAVQSFTDTAATGAQWFYRLVVTP